MKKQRLLIYLLTFALLLGALSGCAPKATTLETILPRANVIKASVSYLGKGLGDNIPQLSYEAVTSECTQLCDLLYAADPVTVEITDSYSPELNASHEIYLTTSGGTMTLYYDDYQNLINVPINRKVDDRNVRVYLSFQAQGLADLLTAWGESLPEPEPVEPIAEPETAFPPDDAELRASIDATLFDQVAQDIAFEPATYLRESDGALYYAFGYHEKSELPQNKVLVVAAPDVADTRQAAITSIVHSDYYVLVTVSYTVPAEGEELLPAAVLCERADIDLGKPVVFLDESRTVLYVQQLSIPGDIPEDAQPAEPSEPSDAAGGEEGDGEPLEP